MCRSGHSRIFKSGWLLPLTSAATTYFGTLPTWSVALELKRPLPLLTNSTNSPLRVTAKPTLPSPLTSTAATQVGLLPTMSVSFEPNPPQALLVSMLRVLASLFAQIKSGRLSPFMSAAARKAARCPR